MITTEQIIVCAVIAAILTWILHIRRKFMENFSLEATEKNPAITLQELVDNARAAGLPLSSEILVTTDEFTDFCIGTLQECINFAAENGAGSDFTFTVSTNGLSQCPITRNRIIYDTDGYVRINLKKHLFK